MKTFCVKYENHEGALEEIEIKLDQQEDKATVEELVRVKLSAD